MPEGFIMINRAQEIVVVNSKCSEMFGYKDGELVGQKLSVLIPSMYTNVHNQHIDNFFATPHSRAMGTMGMQLYGLKQNGIHFPIEVSLGFYNVKEGPHAIAFIVDVTSKKQLDSALKQSEERFSKIFRSAPLSICISNISNGKFIDVNESFLKITKFTKAEIIGGSSITLQSLLPEKDYEQILNLLNQNISVQDFEAQLKTKTGEIIYILISIELIKLNEGASYIIMFNDITQRKLIEKQLEAERNFIKAVDETVDALIMVLDSNGKVISFNKECERVTGYKQKEVIGKISWKLPFLVKEYVDEVREAFQILKQNGGSYKQEVLWKTKKDEKRIIKWSNTTLLNEQGEVTNIIRTGIDITESKKHEIELLNAIVQGEEKERIRLAKDLHDGLSPLLSSVRNNLEAINFTEGKTESRKQKYLDNSILLLQNSIDEVRTMSKDLMPSSLEDYGLVTALQQLCERIDKTVNIKINFYQSGSKLKFNNSIEIALYRIAQELLNNSIKHSKTSEINIHLVKHKNSVVLSLEDKGKGFIYNENQNKGFGLKNITSRVKSLNGFCSVDSRPGKGTLTTIEIPIVK
jgi:PAS domain S-box-containing protein